MNIKKEFVFLIWGCFSMILFGLSSVIISVMTLHMHRRLIGIEVTDTDTFAMPQYHSSVHPFFVDTLHAISILTTLLIISIVTLTFSALLVIGVLTKNAVMVKAYLCYGMIIMLIAKTSFMVNKANERGVDFYGYSYFTAIGFFFFIALGFAIRESCILCRKFKSTMNFVPQKQDDITNEI